MHAWQINAPCFIWSVPIFSNLSKPNGELTETYDIVGSLCENNDNSAVNRVSQKIEIGDYLVIHDAGAHGYAMGFNYNGKLRSAEFLHAKIETSK